MLDMLKLETNFRKLFIETTEAMFNEWLWDKKIKEMNASISDIVKVLKLGRYDLTHEKTSQTQIHALLQRHGYTFYREHHLDKTSIPDLFLHGIAIEVKIKGSKKAIYKQCERYCQFEEVKTLILCTNKAMGFPAEISGKPCYYINIGKAWL